MADNMLDQPKALQEYRDYWRRARKGPQGTVAGSAEHIKERALEALERCAPQSNPVVAKLEGLHREIYLDLLVTHGQLRSDARDRPEPSLEESWHTAQILLEKEARLVDMLKDETTGLIRIGSLAWAKNYWLYADRQGQRASDLDMEVVCTPEQLRNLQDVEQLAGLDHFTRSLEEFMRLFEAHRADFMTFRLLQNDTPVSMHFIPIESFERFCSFDYATATETCTMNEFRPWARSAGYVYKQRDFAGTQHAFEASVEPLDFGIIIKAPLAIVSADGRLVLGYPTDKYLSGNVIHDTYGLVDEGLAQLRRSVVTRLAAERIKFDPNLKLSNAFSRSHRMRPSVKAKIDQATLD